MNLIRQTIRHSLEGDDLHDLAVYLAERILSKRKPKVILWSPEKRNAFREKAQYPGLPDIVYDYKENGGFYTYVVEIETALTPQKMERKCQQFRAPWVTDVIFIDLRELQNEKSWIEIENLIRRSLP